MKPTDEAKRLREEINGIIADMVCDNQSSELTEEIINKALDVVVGRIRIVGGPGTNVHCNAVNELRGLWWNEH